ncbi:GNAT family N-acetyltransferase [bacterium]|nr:GNAT family N-acetyltransferase [candidate division CSSED10-310 bacterium]
MNPNELAFRIYQDSEAEQLAKWISSGSWPFHGSRNPSLNEVRKSIADGYYSGNDNRTFWIYVKEDPDPIGIVSLHELTDVTPIFDVRLKTSVRNRGFGRHIIGWLAEYVFTQTDKHRIEGHTRVDNLAMRRVFKSCGWVMEAYYRKAWPDEDGTYHDAVTYALLKADWETGKSTAIDWNKVM